MDKIAIRIELDLDVPSIRPAGVDSPSFEVHAAPVSVHRSEDDEAGRAVYWLTFPWEALPFSPLAVRSIYPVALGVPDGGAALTAVNDPNLCDGPGVVLEVRYAKPQPALEALAVARN